MFQAEIHAHVSRVEVIAQVEATLLGDPANLLRGNWWKYTDIDSKGKWIGKGWIGRIIPSCGLRRKLGSIFRCSTIFRTMTASKGILLFYSHLPNKKLVIYPNKDSIICSPCITKDDVGKEIIKAAKNLILKLNHETNIDSAIEKIQIRQEILEKKMDQVLESLGQLTKSVLSKMWKRFKICK